MREAGKLLITLVVFTCGGAIKARNVVSTAYAGTNAKKRSEYPALPPELVERIQTGRRAPGVRMESPIAKDWALMNIGFFDAMSPFAATPVKAREESCSSEIVVAVVDTGIDYTHPDLVNNLYLNHGEIGPAENLAELRAQGSSCRDKSCNGIDDDGNGFVDDFAGWDFVHNQPYAYDTHGHGTHISGIITEVASHGMGTAPSCPRIAIMPLKYYDNSGAGYNNLANTVKAIQYAVKNGANIINYSGGGADPAAAERAAIEDANRKGILFVAAAGNDGHNNDITPYFPASYGLDNIIGVASINKQNQLLPSSNWGRSVQIGAPGLMILSTLPEGKFGTMSGTSQATAFVTGAAALIESQMRTHAVTDYRRVKRWLTEGVRPLKANEKKNILAAGLLSLPKSVLIAHEDMVRAQEELALRPGKIESRAR